MARSTVEIELLAQVGEATKTVKRFANDTQKQLSGISFSQNVTAISTGFLAIKAAADVAFSAISGTLGKAIDEAIEGQNELNALAISMRSVGDFTEKAVQDVDNFSKALQAVTTFSAGAIVSAATLAKNYGLTNSEAKLATRAAIEFSAATGKDLNSAITAVGKTFAGFIDRDLGRMIPALKALTDEQLRSGRAADILLERFGGSALAQTATFSGSISQLRNNFNDLFDEFGQGIIKTPELIGAIRGLGAQFGILAKLVAENASAISSFVSLLVTATTGLVAGFALIAKGLSNILAVAAAIFKTLVDPFIEGTKAAVAIAAAIFTLGKRTAEAEAQFKKFFSSLNLLKVFSQTIKNLEEVDDVFDPIIFGAVNVAKSARDAASDIKRLNEELNKNTPERSEKEIQQERTIQAQREKIVSEFELKRKELSELGLSEVQKIELKAAETSKLIYSARNQDLIKSNADRDKLLIALERQTSQQISKIQLQESEKLFAKQEELRNKAQARTAGIAASPGAAIIKGEIKGIQDLAAAGAGFAKSIASGAEGARKIVTDTIGAAANLIIPGIGGIVGEIAGILSQGPEQLKQTIKQFAAAVPEIIKAIILAIPVLVEEISKAIPKIVEQLVAAIPEIINGLVQAMPQVGLALGLQMPKVAIAFVQGIIENIPEIIKGFVQGLIDAAKSFVDALIDAINPFSGGISGEGSGGVFEGIPILGGIGDLFGFAEGGRVPDMARYEGDNFPARLNAGEQILSKDLSSQLERFLSGGSNNGQPLVVNVMVGQQQLARAMLDLNRGGFRTS
jgi:hypothetical protein